jgi:hypothetical protein
MHAALILAVVNETPDITLGELRVAGRRDGVKRAHEVMAPMATHFAAANRGSRMKAPRRTNTRVAIFAGTI